MGPERGDAAAMPETAVAPPPFPGRGGHENGGRGGAPAGIGLLRDPDHYEEINVIGNGKILINVGDPDPQDPHVFEPPRSGSFSQEVRIRLRIRILPFSEIILAK